MIEVAGKIIFVEVEQILIELKKQLSLNGIERFYKTIRSGTNIQTCCPFHKDGQERKPSFGIKTVDGNGYKAGQCHCFTCGWSGTIQEMISNCFGYDDYGVFGEKWLLRNFYTVEVENRKDVDLDFSRGEFNNSSSVSIVSEEELDKYRYYHPYMYKRKLTDEIIYFFDIGYDKETQCITFPIRDLNGNCLFIARRSVNKKFFNYPANVIKPVYGIYEYNLACEIAKKEPCEISCGLNFDEWDSSAVIICESMLDALTCWTHNKYAVALNGLGNNLQFEQLRGMNCRKFILATDNDDAGMQARIRLKRNLTNKIITQYILPEGKKDINELSDREFDELKEIF